MFCWGFTCHTVRKLYNILLSSACYMIVNAIWMQQNAGNKCETNVQKSTGMNGIAGKSSTLSTRKWSRVVLCLQDAIRLEGRISCAFRNDKGRHHLDSPAFQIIQAITDSFYRL
jgi:hypothetical protein